MGDWLLVELQGIIEPKTDAGFDSLTLGRLHISEKVSGDNYSLKF